MKKDQTLGDIKVKDVKKGMLQLFIVGIIVIVLVLFLVNYFNLYSLTVKF